MVSTSACRAEQKSLTQRLRQERFQTQGDDHAVAYIHLSFSSTYCFLCFVASVFDSSMFLFYDSRIHTLDRSGLTNKILFVQLKFKF